MSAGDVSDGVYHGEDDKPESQRNADVGNSVARDIIDDDGAGASENERERPEEFGNQFLSRAKHIRQSECNVRLAVIYVKAYMSRREIVYRVLRRTGRFEPAETFASDERRRNLRLFPAGNAADKSAENFEASRVFAESRSGGGAAGWEVDALSFG